MMRFQTEKEAINFIFRTRRNLNAAPRGLDEETRNIDHTRKMMLATGLPAKNREYAIITGSKGKGSTAVMMAKMLQALGHRTGLITSPHLRTWYERIRVDGKAIPQADFLRILGDLAPAIEAQEATLVEGQYLSPQGIFLLMALQYFDEQGVTAAVIEVGRGGRYDDMSLVPNKLSVFTPIFLEHSQYLGETLERIAWHKSGIMGTGGYAYSLPQEKSVLDVLQREADVHHTEFFWFMPMDLGRFVEETATGLRFELGRYGVLDLPFHALYQIDNATLAIQAVGNMHSRLKGIAHGSEEYIQRIQQGLSSVRWPGRMQKLQDNPTIYVDGAINVHSSSDYLLSVDKHITQPLVIIAGVPRDRNVEGVYQILAEKADSMILTETDIHSNIHFPEAEEALRIARQFHNDVQHTKTLPEALELAKIKAGETGTILLSVAQPLVGEAMIIWDVETEDI